MRNVLNSSVNNTISLNDEIKTIESYLALQKIRYTDKFDFVVDVDPRIETESLTIPPMLAQPFIENSIEHGMKHKKETGHIDIRFRLAGDLIIFEVEDDGIGREKSGEIKSKQIINHQSMATSITRDRLKVLNKKLKKKIELRIIDLKNEAGEATGTKVVMEIPFEVV
jgi:LytS/YehU family sensor histidine kinase